MNDWATLFGYENIEWEDLIWHWLIRDGSDRLDLREWGVILDGLLHELSKTVDLPLDVDEVTYDIEGETQSIDFEIRYCSGKEFQPNVFAPCHAGTVETNGRRRFEGFAELSFVFKNIRLLGENDESGYRYEIGRTDNGKTIWKPVGWAKTTPPEDDYE